MDPIKVLLITGFSRSGSTILGRLLGRQPGVFFGGELHSIWARNFIANERCSCGQPFRDCPHWRTITSKAFPRADFSATGIHDAQLRTGRMRHWPRYVLPSINGRRFNRDLVTYRDAVRSLYHAISEETGSTLIVDTSKNPAYGLVLGSIPEIDLHVVHLVRDCRAVAYSWQRRKLMPDIHWKEEYMERFSALRSTSFWMLTNLLTESYRRLAPHYTFLRYGDFSKEPDKALERIGNYVSLPMREFSYGSPEKALPEAGHSLAGNPNRFHTGTIRIEPDVEWRNKMPALQRVFVTALSFPLLFRYLNRRCPPSGDIMQSSSPNE